MSDEIIYVLGKDGVCRAEPALAHFPPVWVPQSRWQKFKVWLWDKFGFAYYEEWKQKPQNTVIENCEFKDQMVKKQ